MAGIDIESALYVFLNDNVGTVTTSRGDVIALPWYAETDEFDQPTGPYGTYIPIAPEGTFFTEKRAKGTYVGSAVTDTPTYNDGTDDYILTEQDVKSVTQVSGFLAASPHVFVEDVDYELVESNGYATKNTIRWIDGDRPDDASVMTIDYEERLFREFVRSHYFYNYRLMIHAPHHTEGGNLYTKGTFAMEIATHVNAQLQFVRGSAVIDGIVKLHDVSPASAPIISEGESHQRQAMNMRLGIYHDIPVTDVELVGKWSATTQINP